MAPAWSAVLLLQAALAVTVVGLQGAHAVDIAKLKASAHALQPWLKQVRRELHQFPELMFEEHNTSARIRQHLDDLGIPYKHPYAKTGVVGRIGKGKPIIALRADIDALPVQEPEGLAFVSKNSGRMHACGHDGECH
jgi:IAA-amino acid hydrolase